MQTHCQFFLTTSEVFAQFARVAALEDLTNSTLPEASSTEDVTAPSPSYQSTPTEQLYNKSVESPPQELSNKNSELKSSQNVDSPSRLRKHISSFFSKKLGGGKSGAGSGDSAPQSSFYVQTPQNSANLEAGTLDSVTDGAGKLDEHEVSETSGQSGSDLAAGAGPRHSGAVVREPAGAGNNTKSHTSAGELGVSAAQGGMLYFTPCMETNFRPIGRQQPASTNYFLTPHKIDHRNVLIVNWHMQANHALVFIFVFFSI